MSCAVQRSQDNAPSQGLEQIVGVDAEPEVNMEKSLESSLTKERLWIYQKLSSYINSAFFFLFIKSYFSYLCLPL